MKHGILVQNIDSTICIEISSLAVICVTYLWTFINGGNHWELFGTDFEQSLAKNNRLFSFLFSFPLVIPFIRRSNIKRLIIATIGIPVFLFLTICINIIID